MKSLRLSALFAVSLLCSIACAQATPKNDSEIADQFRLEQGVDVTGNPPVAVLSRGFIEPTDSSGLFQVFDNQTRTFRDLATSDVLAANVIRYTSFSLTKANILAMFTTPVEVLAAQGAGTAIELISATIVYDYDTATYGGGGAVSFTFTGGSAISNAISAANSFGAATDKVTNCVELDTANGIPLLSNTGISITNATGVFTDPGTAAGVGRIKIAYRVHSTGL